MQAIQYMARGGGLKDPSLLHIFFTFKISLHFLLFRMIDEKIY